MKINQRVWGPIGLGLSIAYQVYNTRKEIPKTTQSGTMPINTVPTAPIAPPMKNPATEGRPKG